MNTPGRGLSIALSWFILASQAASAQTARDTATVLFVGNSYVYFNNLPVLVEEISSALDGPVLRVDALTGGAYTLRRHLESGRVAEALRREQWDYVILQEQSALGAPLADEDAGILGSPGRFQEAARGLADLIEQEGSETILYMTWAKERFPDQIADLTAAYAAVAAEIGADVAPVGIAWARVREEMPDLQLFQKDGSHPSATGSYLAACVIYGTVAGRTPEGAPTEIEGPRWGDPALLGRLRRFISGQGPVTLVSLAPEAARYLQRVAWETVQAGTRTQEQLNELPAVVRAHRSPAAYNSATQPPAPAIR